MLYKVLMSAPAFRGRERMAKWLRKRVARPLTLTRGGIAMELDPQEWVQNDILGNGCSEPQTIQLLERLLEPGDTFFDVGCHVGFHALQARNKVGANGTVICVDPQPYNCSKVLTNALVNGFTNLLVVPAALGEATQMLILHEQAQSDRSQLRIKSSGKNDIPLKFIAWMVTGDYLYDQFQLQHVKLAKIDTEGAELDVLKGMSRSMRITDNIVLEVLPETDTEVIDQMIHLLRSSGFELFDVLGQPWSRGLRCVENNVWARRLI